MVPQAVKDVFMPALSSTMTEGKITQWLKQEGDKVSKGEPILIVESDKAGECTHWDHDTDIDAHTQTS